MPRWSVRSRILASILLVTALGMTVAGVTAYLVQRDLTLSEIDDRLVSRVESARFVVSGTSDAIDGEGTVVADGSGPSFASTSEALEAVLSRVVPGRNESSLGIIDGKATYVPGVAIDFHLEDDKAFVARTVAEVADGGVWMGTAVTSLGTLRYIAAPVVVDGGTSTGVYLTAVQTDDELAELTSSFSIYALVALLSLVGIGLVGWFVAGRLLRPIRQLRAAASRITASDLSERIPVAGHDDVSELTRTVNEMLDRLEDALVGQRQLLDDVRHELMTPVTIVRGHLELLDPADAAEVSSVRALAIDELDRMTGLIDDIDALARSSESSFTFAPVDVADLTAEVFAKASGIAGPEWILGESAQVIVPVDAARITQAWLQLVDNAVKYAGETPIRIGSSVRSDGVEFWVLDNGPGIPEEARERIFERFGRTDTRRGIRGSGLGLPIVAAIAAAHGGRVRLETSPAGSHFGILVPTAPDLVPTAPDPLENAS